MLTVILILTVLYTQGLVPFWIIYAIISGGFLFSMYFTFIQAVSLKAYCTWCIVSALIFTALFITTSMMMSLGYH